MEHFGIKLINRGKSFEINREEFAIPNSYPSLPYMPSLAEKGYYDIDDDGFCYTDEWCKEYQDLCLKNFDLNMDYFSSLDSTEFNNALNSYLSLYKRFIEVENLNDLERVEGYYIMVLDKYKQIYIGKSTDIKKRIRQHWTKTKPFDRILFPMNAWKTSVISIDSFRILDTTRIFIWKKKISDGVERRLIKDFPAKFRTNRIGGDVNTGLEALATMNGRKLA